MKRTALTFFTMMLLVLFTADFAHADERSRYLIGYEGEVQASEYVDERIVHQFKAIPAAVAELTKEEARQLAKKEGIAYVEADTEVHATGQVVDWGVKTIAAPKAWEHGFTGKGVKIAILDTGVDLTHPDLSITKAKSFMSGVKTAEDDNGHGTHVAGVIAAKNNDIGVVGIAHEASIYVAKVLDHNGDGLVSDVIAALEWALEEKIDIINLSLTGSRASASLEAMLKKVNEEGALIIAATGNYGKSDGTGDTVDYPARYESVIAVAAVDHESRRAPFSGTGEAVEVAAPGVQIYSTFRNGSYEYMDGTSMAAPHVTGHLALLRQADPYASNHELRKKLQEQTIDVGTPGRDVKYGYGIIQIPKDLKAEQERPYAPTELKLYPHGWQEGKAVVQLDWIPAKDGTEPSGYIIYRDQEEIAKVDKNVTTYTDYVGEGAYTYTVRAMNEEGKTSSETKGVTITINRDSVPIIRPSFIDIKGDEWFTYAIYELVNRDIIQGYPDGTMKPNQTITRMEAAVIMTRALEMSPKPYKGNFIDVRKQNYAADYIEATVEANIFHGYGANTFRPHASIERGEIAAVLARSFVIKGEEPVYFPDVTPTYFAYNAIAEIAGANIAYGTPNGNFYPRESVTRAEFASFLTRALQFDKKSVYE